MTHVRHKKDFKISLNSYKVYTAVGKCVAINNNIFWFVFKSLFSICNLIAIFMNIEIRNELMHITIYSKQIQQIVKFLEQVAIKDSLKNKWTTTKSTLMWQKASLSTSRTTKGTLIPYSSSWSSPSLGISPRANPWMETFNLWYYIHHPLLLIHFHSGSFLVVCRNHLIKIIWTLQLPQLP